MIWALVLALCASCGRYSQWQYHHFSQKETETTQILYHSKDPVSGIDLEMIQTDNRLATYLQIHSQKFSSSSEDSQKAHVKISTPYKEITFLAHLHEGRQRIRLSDTLQTMLLSELKEGNPITLEICGYRETIDPKQFKKVFHKLDHPPFKLPIHLPL